MISTSDDEELMFETQFRKYLQKVPIKIDTVVSEKTIQTKKPKSSWLSCLFK